MNLDDVAEHILLPTPRATRGGSSDANGVGVHGDGGLDLRTAVALMPTPKASDGEKGGPNQRGSKGDLALPSATVQLLQTPSVADGTGGHATRSGDRSNEQLLPGQAKEMATNWGPYEAAIRRWEHIFGHPAPAPTELSTKGTHRLSACFAEWMMGVTPGWVTSVPGISRNNQLKAIGNGVCPQQAEAALEDMLRAFQTLRAAA